LLVLRVALLVMLLAGWCKHSLLEHWELRCDS